MKAGDTMSIRREGFGTDEMIDVDLVEPNEKGWWAHRNGIRFHVKQEEIDEYNKGHP